MDRYRIRWEWSEDTGALNVVLHRGRAAGGDGPPEDKERSEHERTETAEERAERNRQRAAVRTQKLIWDYAQANDWSGGVFFTGTFDGGKVDRMDYQACSDTVGMILRRWRRRKGVELMYLMVPDVHQSGAYHYHGLLNGVDALLDWTPYVEINGDMHKVGEGYDGDGRRVYHVDGWDCGHNSATRIEHSGRVATYISSKHFARQICDVGKGMRRVRASRNLSRCRVAVATEDTADVDAMMEYFWDVVGDSDVQTRYMDDDHGRDTVVLRFNEGGDEIAAVKELLEDDIVQEIEDPQ